MHAFRIACLTAAFFGFIAGAGAVDPAAPKAHADRNKDGKVTPVEIKLEKNWEQRQKAKVDTRWEKKVDRDKDGVVEPAEAAAARARGREISAVNRPWEKAADANSDGRVDGKELRLYHVTQMDVDRNGTITVEERRAYWVNKRAAVNTEVEKKYDLNNDGWLSWDEGRELLKDKHTVVMTGGKAIVTTDLEAEFDVNGDGMIDRAEAPALREAIGN